MIRATAKAAAKSVWLKIRCWWNIIIIGNVRAQLFRVPFLLSFWKSVLTRNRNECLFYQGVKWNSRDSVRTKFDKWMLAYTVWLWFFFSAFEAFLILFCGCRLILIAISFSMLYCLVLPWRRNNGSKRMSLAFHQSWKTAPKKMYSPNGKKSNTKLHDWIIFSCIGSVSLLVDVCEANDENEKRKERKRPTLWNLTLNLLETASVLWLKQWSNRFSPRWSR